MPPAPALNSIELEAEMAEVYALALKIRVTLIDLREIPDKALQPLEALMSFRWLPKNRDRGSGSRRHPRHIDSTVHYSGYPRHSRRAKHRKDVYSGAHSRILAAIGYMLAGVVYVQIRPDSATTAERVPFKQRLKSFVRSGRWWSFSVWSSVVSQPTGTG